jgi:hypothetical protein
VSTQPISDERVREALARLAAWMWNRRGHEWSQARADLSEIEDALAALVAVRAERDRARMLVEHLFQMVPEQAWRDSGVYEQGVYEGEYRAMILEREIKGWAAVSSPGEEPNA